jgi:hypothetical protein
MTAWVEAISVAKLGDDVARDCSFAVAAANDLGVKEIVVDE